MIRQRGSTLIEVMLSMGAGSAVMLLGISLVHQTITLNSKSTKGADRNRALDRLARHFRQDAHSANEMQPVSDGSMTLKNRDGSIVTYVAEGSSVVRERKLAEGGDERERFALDSETSAHFAVLSNPERASLVVSKELGLYDTPPRVDLMVETAIGRWQHLELSERGAE